MVMDTATYMLSFGWFRPCRRRAQICPESTAENSRCTRCRYPPPGLRWCVTTGKHCLFPPFDQARVCWGLLWEPLRPTSSAAPPSVRKRRGPQPTEADGDCPEFFVRKYPQMQWEGEGAGFKFWLMLCHRGAFLSDIYLGHTSQDPKPTSPSSQFLKKCPFPTIYHDIQSLLEVNSGRFSNIEGSRQYKLADPPPRGGWVFLRVTDWFLARKPCPGEGSSSKIFIPPFPTTTNVPTRQLLKH